MTIRRAIALLLAGLAVAFLASVPLLVRDHFRERFQESLPAVANGAVIALEADGPAFTMVVEFQTVDLPSPYRLEAPAGDAGLFRSRPRLQPGDPVLVAYDPRDLSSARIVSIRPLWQAIVRRALAAALLLVASVLVFRTRGTNKAARTAQPPAAPPAPARGVFMKSDHFELYQGNTLPLWLPPQRTRPVGATTVGRTAP